MMIFGIGIDVVEVERVESSISEFGERFVNRIFTESEREYCESQKQPSIHYAARFAAKEAVAKALGTGIGKELTWLDMEIRRRESGEPEVFLSGAGEQFCKDHNLSQIKVSLSHAQHYAAANAMVLSES